MPIMVFFFFNVPQKSILTKFSKDLKNLNIQTKFKKSSYLKIGNTKHTICGFSIMIRLSNYLVNLLNYKAKS